MQRKKWGRRSRFAALVTLASPVAPAFAEVCDTVRPDWAPGTSVSAFGEFGYFIYEPSGLLIAAVLAVVLLTRLRFTALAGAALAFALAGLRVYEHLTQTEIGEITQISQAARAEGCIGAPWVVAAALIASGMLMLAISRSGRGRN